MIGILTYIFAEFISPVDSVFIARNAVNEYLKTQQHQEPTFVLNTGQMIAAIATIIFTQMLIFGRERYVRFRDSINTNTFIVNWNMTLVRRIDHQIVILEHNIPIIKSLINDALMPTVHEKPVIVEYDLDRIMNIKINEVTDIFVNFRKFKEHSVDDVLQITNQQFGNYVTLKNSIEQYKELTRKDQDEVFKELNKSVLDFTTKLVIFIKENIGVDVVGMKDTLKIFGEFEQKKSNTDLNGRKLEHDYMKSMTSVLSRNYATMYKLKEFDTILTTANNVQLQYYHFFRLLDNKLRGVLILHDFLKRVRKHICEIQINLLENELKGIYSFLYLGYNTKSKKFIDDLNAIIKNGIEDMRKQIEKQEKEEQEANNPKPAVVPVPVAPAARVTDIKG